MYLFYFLPYIHKLSLVISLLFGQLNNPTASAGKLQPVTPATCLEYVLAENLSNSTEKAVFSGLDLRLGRWDAKRLYKVFDYAVVGEKFADLTEKYSVCLATQSSLEKIYSLVQVSHHWTGPISIAMVS